MHPTLIELLLRGEDNRQLKARPHGLSSEPNRLRHGCVLRCIGIDVELCFIYCKIAQENTRKTHCTVYILCLLLDITGSEGMAHVVVRNPEFTPPPPHVLCWQWRN